MSCSACKEGEKGMLQPDDVVKTIPASALKPGVFNQDIIQKAAMFNSIPPPPKPSPIIDPTPPVIQLPIEVNKTLPSYKEMAFGLTESVKTTLMQIAKGGQAFAEKHTVDMRMGECLKCDFLIPAQSRCSKCGCFMNVKTRLQTSKCPIGKW